MGRARCAHLKTQGQERTFRASLSRDERDENTRTRLALHSHAPASPPGRGVCAGRAPGPRGPGPQPRGPIASSSADRGRRDADARASRPHLLRRAMRSGDPHRHRVLSPSQTTLWSPKTRLPPWERAACLARLSHSHESTTEKGAPSRAPRTARHSRRPGRSPGVSQMRQDARRATLSLRS